MPWLPLAALAMAILCPRAASAQSAYAWNQTGSASFATAGNWSPTRTSPAASDILIINGSTTATPTLTNVPTQTIGRLQIINGASPTFTSTGAATLTVSGGASPAFFISSTSGTTTFGGAAGLKLAISSGALARVYSTLAVTGAGDSLLVSGTLGDSGSVTTASSGGVELRPNGTYQRLKDGGTVPTAAWDVNSTCLITGAAGTVPGGLGQAFGDFTWNCTGQTAANLVTGDLAINGDFTLASTGGGSNMISLGGGNSQSITIGGNYVQTGGNFEPSTKTNKVATLTAGGGFSLSGGSLIAGADLTASVAGDFSYTGGGTLAATNSPIHVVFNGSGAPQNFTSGGSISGTNGVDFTVNSGAALYMGTSTMTGSAFTLSAGGTLGVGSANGITRGAASGNIRTTARTYTAAANYIYNGSSAQHTGNGIYNAPGALNVSNPAGVTLDTTITVGGTLTLADGTLAVGTNTMTLNGAISQTSGSISSGATGTVSYNQGSAGQAVATGSYGNLTFSNFNKVLPSSGTVGIAGTFTPGTASGHTITGSTLDFTGGGAQTIPAFSYNNLSSSGNGNRTLAASGTVGIASTFSPGSGTYTLTGSTVAYNGSLSQALPAGFATYNNLTVNNGAGVTLGAGITVNGVLTFTSGTLTTGAGVVAIPSSGSVSRTSGHVVGNLSKFVATGATSRTFEIGDASNYTPVTVAFGSVTVAGTLQASTAAGDHPQLGSSSIIATKSVNRYWTLANSGITFTTCAPTFNFVAGDVDAGASTSNFRVGRYAAGTWTYPPVGTRTSTSTQATALTGFGDFAIGERDSTPPTVTVSAPNGGETWGAGTSHNITWSAADNVGVTAIDLDYSLNNGGSWTGIVTGLSNSGTYSWTLPNVSSTQALVRATAHDAAANTATDASNAVFSISDLTAPTVAVTAPNGGETWVAGSTHTLTWTAADANGVTSIDLAYSTNSGGSFTDITTGISNTGTYDWVVPGIPGTATRIQVRAHDAAANVGSDVSDADFTVTTVPSADSVYAVFAGYINTVDTSVSVPVQFARANAGGVRSYHVKLQLSSGLHLSGSITAGTYLSSVGTTSFTATSNGGGSYTVDETIVGLPCGAVGSAALFYLPLGSHVANAHASVSITEVTVRDCSSALLPGDPGRAGLIAVDKVAPAAIADLAGVRVSSGNDADGTTRVQVSFGSLEPHATVEVYRAAYGGYPEYATGSVPAVPGGYPPASPWTLTSVTSSGQTDETTTRDFYYFVAYATDSAGNRSLVSNRSTGSVNYHLGDFSDGVTACSGDNHVDVSDVSLLGAHYGETLSPGGMDNCIDIGPTTDGGINSRPTPDYSVDFEDLILLGINYSVSSRPLVQAGLLPTVPHDELTADVSGGERPGDILNAALSLRGSGHAQGLSARLRWNPGVVTPTGATAGPLLTSQGGVALSPAPGAVDMALLGVGPQGLAGEGVLASLAFKRIAEGDPAISIEHAVARDKSNKPVDVNLSPVVLVPKVTRLYAPSPNPAHGAAGIDFSLSVRGAVELSIYGVDGRRVVVLASGAMAPGNYHQVWSGMDSRGIRVGSGVFFARLRTPAGTFTRALTLLR